MEDNVKKELDTIEIMVSRWKDNYISFITGENDDFLLDELMEEIGSTYVYSYVCRLREMEHINNQEASEFMGRCYEQARELKDVIDKARK